MNRYRISLLILITTLSMSQLKSQYTESTIKINPDYVPHYLFINAALSYPNQAYYLSTDNYPRNLSKLHKLEYLYFSNKVDSALISELNKTKASIKRLSMFDCNVDSLYLENRILESLVYFSLSYSKINNINSAIETISKLNNIETLINGDCGFTTFYEEWTYLPNLKVVGIGTENVYDYDYESAYSNLAKLSSLEKLAINSSGITSFPESFQKLNHLKALSIYNCKNLAPETVFNAVEKWKNLERLRIAKNLETIPVGLVKHKALKAVDLSKNEPRYKTSTFRT